MHKWLLLLVACPIWSFAQLEEARRITETLCSPAFHGRGYVNGGDSIAAEFIAEEFKRIGVEALGKGYFQCFEMPVNTFPGKMSMEQDGQAIVPGKEFVVDPSSGGTGRRHFELVELPLKAYWNESELVTVLRTTIESNQSGRSIMLLCDLTELKGDSLRHAQGFVHELSTMVPILEVIDTKFTWSVGHAQESLLYVQVQKSALKNRESLDLEIEARMNSAHVARNVVAYLPATTKSKETIVFSAHYDHLGRMGSDTYFPGANDNASGTAMLLDMARKLKAKGSDYNILFIAFAGEEAGLVGSKYFVEHPMLKLDKIKFLVNLDIMGSGEEGVTVVNATLFENHFALLDKINTEKEYLVKVKQRGPAANSDHYWFTEKGVPAFFIYTMGPNKHYHDVFDTYEELSFNEFNDISSLLVEFVSRLKDL